MGQSLSRVQLFATLRTVGHQPPLSVGCSRQEYWSGWPCPPPGDLPDPGIRPTSPLSAALAGWVLTTSTIWEALTPRTKVTLGGCSLMSPPAISLAGFPPATETSHRLLDLLRPIALTGPLHLLSPLLRYSFPDGHMRSSSPSCLRAFTQLPALFRFKVFLSISHSLHVQLLSCV